MGKKLPKNGEKMGSGVIFLFFRHSWAIFSPFRAEGHSLFFGQFFSHFWISARFPFYARQPDSQASVELFTKLSLESLVRAPGCLPKKVEGVI